ncbi:MAG: glycosyltransferase [Sphingobacteriales bacterium]|nr:MAG: glycosyltransferase [Sphingobacteriales bacterium]
MKISVVIPIKNGAATLGLCLEKIRAQTIGDIEIILLDSMSEDESKSIGLQYGATIVDIPPGTFNHGLTRNIGVQHASGDLIYFTVQDAWLAENDMLERMSVHFIDADVQAVCGHQATPWGHRDKNPAYWFKRYSDPETEVRHFPVPMFHKLSETEQFKLSGWDNVNAMYRKAALQKIPFRKTNFSEDWLWANDALRSGLKLVCDTAVVAYHYHHHSFKYRFRTQYIVNYQFYNQFNQLPRIPWSVLKFLRAAATIVKRNEVSLFKKPYWVLHNAGINAADFLSNCVFRLSLFFGKDKLLDRTYKLFCSEIPQGSLKA